MIETNLLERLNIEIEEKIVTNDSYIYVIRKNDLKDKSIIDWYYTDSVDDLKDFRNEMFESKEFSSISDDVKGNFDDYINKLIKDKPYLEKMKVSDVLNELNKEH